MVNKRAIAVSMVAGWEILTSGLSAITLAQEWSFKGILILCLAISTITVRICQLLYWKLAFRKLIKGKDVEQKKMSQLLELQKPVKNTNINQNTRTKWDNERTEQQVFVLIVILLYNGAIFFWLGKSTYLK